MKLLVLDGNSIFNRAFYGIKSLSTKSGQPTNAIYGFLTMLDKIESETNHDAVAVAFDMRTPTFRHKAFAGYKAKRKGMPEELAVQFPVLKELLMLLGYALVECEGFEADDILGTMSRQCIKDGNECVIATGDRDSLQLVSPYVSVRLAGTKLGRTIISVYDEAMVMNEYGVKPRQLIDIKAIQGDASDNIPGVPGIGEKGARELIAKFETLDEVYKNINSPEIKESTRKKLLEGRESAYMSRMLGTIRVDVPVDTDIYHYVRKPVNVEAITLMRELEFFSLIDKMNLNQDLPGESVLFDEDDFLCEGKVHKISEDKHIVELLENVNMSKQTYDCKKAFAFCLEHGINVQHVTFDVLLAAYIIDPSAKDYSPGNLLNECREASLEGLVNNLLMQLNDRKQQKLLTEIEIPLAKVLVDMEKEGFCVNAKGIKEYGKVIEAQMWELQREIYNDVGYEFNINSPKQLGQVLFEKLELPAKKKTKSGYSTSADVLEGLKYMHPDVAKILEYRALSKLKSTYCDGLLKSVLNGRIHSKFNQTETRTGRISSTEPNLQNIPVKTEIGRKMRKFFCAKEGCVLVDADYSQIELRLLACMAEDDIMIRAFENKSDIHAITASQVFNVPLEMVTPVMRSRAKAVNFGIIYGMGAFSLSKEISVTQKEAQAYIDSYFNHYKGVKKYLEYVVKKAYETGYAETMFSRRRYLPELKASNFNLRAFGERVAKNMPIQGTAADIIKMAMIRVYARLRGEGLHAKLVLQIHDELIVEVIESEAETVRMLLKDEMENTVNLGVQLVADANIGKTWYDAKI